MKIQEIIEKYYDYFHSLLPNTEQTLYEGNTYEDILDNSILTAIKRYKDKDIQEIEGYNYIRKTLLTEILFSKKRKSKDKLIFTDNIIAYDNGDYEK